MRTDQHRRLPAPGSPPRPHAEWEPSNPLAGQDSSTSSESVAPSFDAFIRCAPGVLCPFSSSASEAGRVACIWPGTLLRALFLYSAQGSNHAGQPVLGQHLQGPHPDLDAAPGNSGEFFGGTNPAAAPGPLSPLPSESSPLQGWALTPAPQVHRQQQEVPCTVLPRGQAPTGIWPMRSRPPFQMEEGICP